MSKLLSVQENVQHIAESISSVLDVETMILDENLRIIAGTGKYAEQIGSFEAEAFLPEEYLYKYILRIGGTYVVDDINDSLYGPELYGETGEICCAIPYHTGSVGIISLVSFNDEQRGKLIGNSDSICNYLLQMSQLISSFLSNSENFDKLKLQAKKLNEVVNSSPHCILVLDEQGCITEYNQKAKDFLQNGRDDFWGIMGKSINTFWENARETLLSNPTSLNNHEMSFQTGNRTVQILVSSRVVTESNQLKNLIIFFDDMNFAKTQAKKILQAETSALDDIKGNSPLITSLKSLVTEVADSNSTVLITGESGTGKELFAKALHYSSSRGNKPFVTINCGAIPEHLIESELFGYEPGAFTGASPKGYMGRFEKANGGTVFIDEIGELPLNMQIRFLHVLQRKQLERIGSTKTIDVDIRIIAATNKNLMDMINEGSFRADLYYRLNVIPINVPSLAQRAEDIPVLANHFVRALAKEHNKDIEGISSDAMDILLSYSWPGNVRELENAIAYGVNMTSHSVITSEDLPPFLVPSGANPVITSDGDINYRDKVSSFQKNLLLSQLEDVRNGKMTKTELARKLGISRSSLYRKISKL